MPSSEVMHKFKKGKLHSGSKHGKVVTDPAQAKAILMSEKRTEAKHGGKYPHPKKKKKDHKTESQLRNMMMKAK